MKKRFHLAAFLFLSVFVFSLFVRFYKFDSIPGEWFGDISNVHEYVSQIIRGERPFYFFQSPGPLYHYLIVPIVLLYKNHGFETYKIASIAVSILGLVSAYLFVREISSRKLALITTLTMGFSFWYLIWSRLGNSQIVISVLVSLMSLFIARYINRKKSIDLFLAAVSASLGWYTYPQTFILPAVFFLFMVFYLIGKRKFLFNSKRLLIVLIMLAIMAVPFINIVRSDQGNFGPHGYVGGKLLPNLSKTPDQLISKTVYNWEKTILMLHVKGDGIFRANIPGEPQLDQISGIFFFLGFLYFLQKKRRIWLFYIVWMLLILPIPSISPAIPDAEIPSSGRTIAVVPFVYLLVSAGLLWSYQFIFRMVIRHSGDPPAGGDSRIPRRFWTSQNDKTRSHIVLITLFSIIYSYIVFSNLKLYFVDYTNGLPDGNSASGKIIAGYIDQLPKDVNIYFGSCCWGEWGHPEPKAVAYVLRKPRDFIEYSHYLSDCREVTRFPAVVILGPDDSKKEEEYKSCFPAASVSNIEEKGILVAREISIP